jgi:uncharacterized protein YdaL
MSVCRLALALLTALCFWQPSASAQAPLKTLVLYDAPTGGAYDKLGQGYGIMLRNLLGHFDGDVDLAPVQSYVAGKLYNYNATFYLGSSYDNPIPASFLADVANNANLQTSVQKTIVWFKYNLWQLAWDTNYQFTSRTGLSFTGLRGLNGIPSSANPNPGFFNTVNYKNMGMVKYYAYDSASNTVNADPDIGATTVSSPAQTLVTVSNKSSNEILPYVVRSGNFWYFADVPLSYIGPRDRYLVLADLLHDILGVQHPVNHRAMVRLEDVSALVSVSTMKTLSDYLSKKKIPFAIATIPHYLDPLGAYNGGVPEEIPLSQASNLNRSLSYAIPRGGQIVMHGYTHQYSNMKNKNTGVSGDDYEFWNIVDNTPVVEEKSDPLWASRRLKAGLAELAQNGYTPFGWEAPHYQSSPDSIKAVPSLFTTTYQRVVYYTSDHPVLAGATSPDFAVGQFYPYIIKKDYYGQRVLPENLGNIEYNICNVDPSSCFDYTWQDLYMNAQYALTVRDGFASFFFHPFWLEADIKKPGFADFQSLVSGITGLGYTWVSPKNAQ